MGFWFFPNSFNKNQRKSNPEGHWSGALSQEQAWLLGGPAIGQFSSFLPCYSRASAGAQAVPATGQERLALAAQWERAPCFSGHFPLVLTAWPGPASQGIDAHTGIWVMTLGVRSLETVGMGNPNWTIQVFEKRRDHTGFLQDGNSVSICLPWTLLIPSCPIQRLPIFHFLKMPLLFSISKTALKLKVYN